MHFFFVKPIVLMYWVNIPNVLLFLFLYKTEWKVHLEYLPNHQRDRFDGKKCMKSFFEASPIYNVQINSCNWNTSWTITNNFGENYNKLASINWMIFVTCSREICITKKMDWRKIFILMYILYQFVSFMWIAYLMYSICKSQIHKWFEVKKKYSMKS